MVSMLASKAENSCGLGPVILRIAEDDLKSCASLLADANTGRGYQGKFPTHFQPIVWSPMRTFPYF